MRLILGTIIALPLVLGVAAATPASAATCGTQGALALALAQTLDLGIITTQDAAYDALGEVLVTPEGGWQGEECIDDVLVAEIDQLIRRAVAAGLLEARKVKGALGIALASIGEGGRSLRIAQGSMRSFGRSHSPIGGPPPEGTFRRASGELP